MIRSMTTCVHSGSVTDTKMGLEVLECFKSDFRTGGEKRKIAKME